jgi:hypothetical protein
MTAVTREEIERAGKPPPSPVRPIRGCYVFFTPGITPGMKVSPWRLENCQWLTHEEFYDENLSDEALKPVVAQREEDDRRTELR